MRPFFQKSFTVLGTVLILSLSGCSSGVVNNVTRFHSLPTPKGETIEVVSLNSALQNSLEFGQYAELVGSRLGAFGYVPPQGTASELVARIGYYIQASNRIIDDGPRSSVGVGMGGGSHHSSVGVGISIPIGNNEPRVDYIRTLTLDIIRRADGIKLYEGKVTSQGPEGLPMVMPSLIEALFQNFPDESGTSSKVRIER
ncbi:MAG: DUF4136 domain-containing protein [Emcibacter sp.]|nr:DUF4136 domain-containing protein [Emcibacter sp.]